MFKKQLIDKVWSTLVTLNVAIYILKLLKYNWWEWVERKWLKTPCVMSLITNTKIWVWLFLLIYNEGEW